MAFTNKGAKWEIKNSLFLILSFIPFLNTICLFHMSGKIENKKWRKLGWICLSLNILMLIVMALVNMVNVPALDLPTENKPKIEDYLGWDYRQKYTYDEYTKLEEYYNYQVAYDEWSESEEVRAAYDEHDRALSQHTGIVSGVMLAYVIMNLFFFFYIISQRANYLRELAKYTNKKSIINKLENTNLNSVQIKKENEVTANVSEVSNVYENKAVENLDINKATEEEISNLPGLTIIDAKRAITYREQNSGFKTVQDFYDAINAKPHVVAKLDSIIFVGKSNLTEDNTATNSRRRIDL